MKILAIDNSPAMGGSVHHLAAQIRVLSESGARFRLIASNPDLFADLLPPDVPVSTISWPGFRDVFRHTGALADPVLPGSLNRPFSFLAYRRLASMLVPEFLRALDEDPPDLVHINNLNLPNKVFGDALAARGMRFTLGAQMIRLFGRTEAAFATQSVRVVCVSRAVRACLFDQMPGVPRELYVIAENGIDPARYAVARDRSVLAELGVPPDAPVVLSLARLIEWKGHDVLARAMGGVPGAWLVQAGGEESLAWRERVQAIARDAGAGDRFVIAGIRSDVPRLLGAADVLAHSSKYDRAEQGVVEAFGRVIVEAMAAGVPVVATDVGGAAEIFRHDDGTPWTHDGVAPGRLVPARDFDAMAGAIRHYLDRPDDARRAGEAGRVRARDYDERVTAKKLAEVFDAAAGEGARATNS